MKAECAENIVVVWRAASGKSNTRKNVMWRNVIRSQKLDYWRNDECCAWCSVQRTARRFCLRYRRFIIYNEHTCSSSAVGLTDRAHDRMYIALTVHAYRQRPSMV